MLQSFHAQQTGSQAPQDAGPNQQCLCKCGIPSITKASGSMLNLDRQVRGSPNNLKQRTVAFVVEMLLAQGREACICQSLMTYAFTDGDRGS